MIKGLEAQVKKSSLARSCSLEFTILVFAFVYLEVFLMNGKDPEMKQSKLFAKVLASFRRKPAYSK